MSRSITTSVVCCALFCQPAISRADAPKAGPPHMQKLETGPKATKTPKALQFSENPTVEEIFQAHVFPEPLVVVGRKPTRDENSALAAALIGYSKRSGPDDFSALTDFLKRYPKSPWAPALLTGLGLEYYNTAHYSLTMDAWSEAWTLAKDATEPKARALADQALGELIYMKARLGRMDEIEELLNEIKNRPVSGPATEKVAGVREALWNMKNRPEIAFRCGPLALRSILTSDQSLQKSSSTNAMMEIFNSASTTNGFSLSQVAELSKKVGLNFQMAFREKSGGFIVPSVVHWKVGHYAALVRKEGNLYQSLDPTFGNETWATKEALEEETSGYFLVPSGSLPHGWRSVKSEEGGAIWGKGQTGANDRRAFARNDKKTSDQVCRGMAVPTVHLMLVSLNVNDEPLGYTPPVGPPVRLTLRYNERDSFQPANFNYSNLGPKWTCDWISYLTDNPSNSLADVDLYAPGGGVRTFSGFDANTQMFLPQQYDQTILKRTGEDSYDLLYGDGSKLVFSQSDGSIATARHVFLTQMVDPAGNAVTLGYDDMLRIVTVTDAIGQVTTLTYSAGDDPYRLTQVTDPFGRSASFVYQVLAAGQNGETGFARLTKIIDVIGLTSQFAYLDIVEHDSQGHVIGEIFTTEMQTLTTPYGTTSFSGTAYFPVPEGNTRVLEITYPDGSRERVEYNQTVNIPVSDPPTSVPVGMSVVNAFLNFRNTFFWDRTACAIACGDYTKARIYHWLHKEDLGTTSGALESIKQPLEGRVWFDYSGQNGQFTSLVIGLSTRPTHIGRVLDDGSTQLYTYAYDPFGHVTNSIDPIGRTFSYVYDTNSIDLLEVRQIRRGNELLLKTAYNSEHRPLTVIDPAGQTTAFTYNGRGQVITVKNSLQEGTTFVYNANGYLMSIDGPLPGPNDLSSFTYDAFGRNHTVTDISGYTITFDFDDLDRITRVTYPDTTSLQYNYDRLDLSVFKDRAGRQTLLEHDNMRQVTTKTDALGRMTHFEWCRCGAIKSLTDPMGRTMRSITDVQGRRIAKQYPDGSQIQYVYENTTGRIQAIIDEKRQTAVYAYNRDNTLKGVVYDHALIPTPSVSFTYDPDYNRVTTMTDGTGNTKYSYIPMDAGRLGAGEVESIDGPLDNDTIVYQYDELGRPKQVSIDGSASSMTFDASGRLTGQVNALGAFTYQYSGASTRLLSQTFPNGQTATLRYGSNLEDFRLLEISFMIGQTSISRFTYNRDIPRRRIATWSQQAGTQPASVFSFAYDDADQLTSATVTEPGSPTHSFVYVYDPSGNRLSEQVDGATTSASYNALNQITSSSSPGAGRTNEWDALNRLTAVNIGNQRTEFKYNGRGQMVDIRKLVNGSEISHRRFLWCRGRICEERDGTGSIVTKRYFPQGMRMESGPLSGSYYYTRDHLGSIRDVTDGSGSVRGRYSYDPFGRRSFVTGDVQADFGFAGMFWSSEVALAFTHFRAYEPELGRWLSRDPLKDAEAKQGPNLYAYVGNEPIGRIDPAGLAGTSPGLGFNTVSVTILAACSTGSCQELIDDLAPTLEIPAANPQLVQDTAECAEDLAPQASDISLRLQDLAQRAPAVARVATTFLQNTEAVQPWTKLSLVGELPSTFSVMPESVLQWEEDLQDLAWELSEWATAKGENPIDHYAGILRDLITRVNLDPETWKPPE